MCRSLTHAIGDDLKGLTNVDDEGSRNVWHVNPVASLIENLKTLDVRRRGLE